MKPLYDPGYDPLWKVREDLEIPVNVHGGTGVPDYGNYPFSMLLYITEVGVLLAAAVRPPDPRRRVRALPEAQVRDDRDGLRVGAADCSSGSTSMIIKIRETGATGEIRYTEEHVLPMTATEYFQQNCWMGVSQPGPADAAAATTLGRRPVHVGQRLPARRGHLPVHP